MNPDSKSAATLQITLRAIGGTILLVALMHIVLGPNADVLLGANTSAASLTDPTIDSQNRFYGAAFALYGVILIICSSDLVGYRRILIWTLIIFLIAGLARLISVAVVGWPPILVVVLLLLELIVPPPLIAWLRKI